MNNQLQIFNNQQFGQVRALLINNEPHFVGKDVAVALGYTKLDAMYRVIDIEDKRNIDPQNIEFTGFPQNGATLESNKNVRRMTIINESGLYSAIFGSKLEKAKEFKRWVTSEVLPSIRKTGSYDTKAEPKSHKEEVFELIKSLPNDDCKNSAVEQIMIFVNSENMLKTLPKQKAEMSENAFRDLVVEFMNENDVFIKRHKQGLIIDKDALYKYFSQYGWTQHDVLETLDKYRMIYHKGEDKTHQIILDGKLVRTLIIQ